MYVWWSCTVWSLPSFFCFKATVKSPQAQSGAQQAHTRQCVSWDQSGIDRHLPKVKTFDHPWQMLPLLVVVFEHCYYIFLLYFQICFINNFFQFLMPLCLFAGTDALCWKQEFHGTWAASSGGLLSVHKLLCFSSIPPHGRVWQSGPRFEAASFVSTVKYTELWEISNWLSHENVYEVS